MVELIRYAHHWLTDDEKREINVIVQVAIDRLLGKRKRNGACPCRCAWPLDDDGTNACPCCNEPVLELPDDLY